MSAEIDYVDPHRTLSDDECGIMRCVIHGLKLADGSRVALVGEARGLESLEEKIDRIDHNLQVLLDTVQQVLGSFEKNPMAKMFMNRMGK